MIKRHVYRCERCRLSTPPLPLHRVHAERQRHRDEFHGGLVPDGETITTGGRSERTSTERWVVALVLTALLISILARLIG
ncbi:hypothetical protein ACFWIQ_36340 [Kitasatospora sp. NPDC127059]|uniref:hypothetical protein n=1 Tax=Kitasatospora sp. NPDC127059 TaxID=3347120 RepID=UPI0036671DF0